VVVEALAAALICLDPGHGTPPEVGRQREPIGPGSRVLKIKDGGGAAGETEVVLQIAYRTRALLLRRGYRVALTRTGPWFRYGSGGNIARAQFCNRREAALMLRIHADGSTDWSMTSPAEARLLRSPAYQQRVANGLAAGVAAFRAP
jgi:N-acetylmuramoyl-L-alanine amidase